MSKDLDEVTSLINLYIEGAGKGNAEKLNKALHLHTLEESTSV